MKHSAYANACAMGCVYELKPRLLCENRPETRQHAHARRLEDVEEAIITTYGNLLRPGEAEQLRITRQLRNKVLHCTFDEAHQKLEELGKPAANACAAMRAVAPDPVASDDVTGAPVPVTGTTRAAPARRRPLRYSRDAGTLPLRNHA